MAEDIQLVKPTPGILSLGIALDLLHQARPFANWQAAQLVGTVRGAIRRGHYLFIKDGGRFVGFACWGECTDEVGDAWSKGEAQPSFKQCTEGDAIVLFIVHMQDEKYMREAFKLFRKEYSGRTLYGRRHKNRKIRPLKLHFR